MFSYEILSMLNFLTIHWWPRQTRTRYRPSSLCSSSRSWVFSSWRDPSLLSELNWVNWRIICPVCSGSHQAGWEDNGGPARPDKLVSSLDRDRGTDICLLSHLTPLPGSSLLHLGGMYVVCYCYTISSLLSLGGNWLICIIHVHILYI